jgi:polysaccharide biosynthesis protein PslH
MVSSFLPYPLHSGGHTRLYNLIRELSDKHEITLICEKRKNQIDKDINEVEKISKKVITVERHRQWSISNILKTAISAKSFLTTGHTHKKMQEEIAKELIKNEYDLIHVETFYVMQNLPKYILERSRAVRLINNESPKAISHWIPIVLVEHNIEYQVYKRFADNASLMVRPLLYFDVAKLKIEEESYWKEAAVVVAVSKNDEEIIKEERVKTRIVANGVDVEKFAFSPRTKNLHSASSGHEEPRNKKVLFIGDFKWMQNRDSVKFIIEEIWPQINLKLKTENIILKLWIVGREIPREIKAITNDPNVIFDEKNSNRPTEELFQEADLLLAPIRIGGGTSYKILESMSCGTPVITTELSAQAIDAKDGEEIMVAEKAEDFAQKTLQLLDDQDLYQKIAKNGRSLIEKNYTWKEIANDLDDVYKSLI